MSIPKAIKTILLLLIIISCNRVPEGIIPKEKIIAVIEDVHVTDALLQSNNISKSNEKALQYYEYIYSKHGITKEEFDSSMEYYAKNPKMLRKAYPEILRQLEVRDSLLKVKQQAKTDTLQLWQERTAYKFEKYTNETLPVSILVSYPKTYTISAEIKIYGDSQVKEISPRFTFVAPDTTYVLPTKTLTTDTIFQKFEISDMVKDSTVIELKGDFFPLENDSVEQFKHYEIRKIQIFTTDINFETTSSTLSLE